MRFDYEKCLRITDFLTENFLHMMIFFIFLRTNFANWEQMNTEKNKNGSMLNAYGNYVDNRFFR